MSVLACDVSEFQTPVTNAYPHDWLIFRACDGTYRDRNAAKNLAWAKQAAKSGRIAGFTVYCVYRPNTATLATVMQVIGQPDPHMTVMVDVESWGGVIRGNHSQQITALVNGLAAWLGDPRRVIAYGNQNDLATIYPNRPSWLRLIVASYGSQQPRMPNMIGWQYSDGQKQWPVPAGLPRSSKPFGACDHNIFPGVTAAELAATLGVGDDMPLTDAEIQKIANAAATQVWATRFKNPVNGHAYTASSYLVYANLFGSQAKAAIGKLPGVVVDAATVGAAITADVRTRLAAMFGGTQ